MFSWNLARTQKHLPQVKPCPGRARPPGSSARRALPIAQSDLRWLLSQVDRLRSRTARIHDAAQHRPGDRRAVCVVRDRDYDIVVASWGQSLSPGNEQRGFWSSKAADQAGSRNLVGIKNPAVDALVERLIFATNRADLVAATKALDRVLLWNHYVVPQWTYPYARTVRWDRFSHPEMLPKYGASAFPTVWWWDKAKAGKVGSRS